jgi:hypothetical protein
MLLAGDPQPELGMGLDCGLFCSPRHDHLVNFLHKLKPKMTILQRRPSSSLQPRNNSPLCNHFLALAHTNLLHREFLLFPGKLINRGSRIRPRRQQEQNRHMGKRLGPNRIDGVRNGLGVLRAQDGGDKPRGSHLGPILPHAPNDQQLYKGPHLLFLECQFIRDIRHRHVLGVVFLEQRLPADWIFLDYVGQVPEVGSGAVVEAVLADGDYVQPDFVPC